MVPGRDCEINLTHYFVYINNMFYYNIPPMIPPYALVNTLCNCSLVSCPPYVFKFFLSFVVQNRIQGYMANLRFEQHIVNLIQRCQAEKRDSARSPKSTISLSHLDKKILLYFSRRDNVINPFNSICSK